MLMCFSPPLEPPNPSLYQIHVNLSPKKVPRDEGVNPKTDLIPVEK